MPQSPLSWTLLVVLVYALGSNVDWLLRTNPEILPVGLGRWLSWHREPRYRQRLRLLFLAGLPILAISLRVPSPSQIGLPGLVPNGQMGDTHGSNALAFAGLVLAYSVMTIALIVFGRIWHGAAHGKQLRLSPSLPAVERLGPALLDGLAQQLHWALVRAGIVSLGFENAALTMFISLSVLGLEAWSDPDVRTRAEDPEQLRLAGQTTMLATLSGLVFATTGSSLGAMIAHGLVLCGVMVLLPSAWLDRGAAPRAAGPVLQVPYAGSEGDDELEVIEPTVV